MKKKLIALVVAMTLILNTSGCSKKSEQNKVEYSTSQIVLSTEDMAVTEIKKVFKPWEHNLFIEIEKSGLNYDLIQVVVPEGYRIVGIDQGSDFAYSSDMLPKVYVTNEVEVECMATINEEGKDIYITFGTPVENNASLTMRP